MKNYTDTLYNLQKQYIKQINLMLKDSLTIDFKEIYSMLQESGHNSRDNIYSIADGKELVWIDNSKGKQQVLIETQNRLFTIELSELLGYADFKVYNTSYNENEKALDGRETFVIYQWYTAPNKEITEFDLTVNNLKTIVTFEPILKSFLLNWQSLHYCLTENEGDSK